ncbi:MAG: hypothetical protein H6Q38_2452, partial [Chloroflexi bacterium]|nr:hypothetical protein [Chloroflexota bacterium]
MVWLLALPTAPGTGLLGSISPGRLAALAPGLLLLAVISLALVALQRRPSRADEWATRLVSPPVYWSLIAISALYVIFALYFLAVGLRTTDQFLSAYIQRLLPSVIWGLLLATQSLLAMRILRHGFDLIVFRPYRSTFIASLIAGAALITIALFIL